MSSASLWTILLVTVAVAGSLPCWAAAGSGSPSMPRPEHPRPDFQRADWLNLNGVWEFEVDAQGDGEARGLISGRTLAERITVPFCPESKLSGLNRTEFMTHVWYRRMFEVPDNLRGRRLRLHFGAVDWHARVWLNGTFVGEHRGGYTPFALEITDQVRAGANELVLHAIDETCSGTQAAGKQSQRPESYGCFYTRTTGIWQTVWLEAVGRTWLRDFTLRPDLDGGRVIFQGWLDGPQEGVRLRLRAWADGELVAESAAAGVPAGWRSTMEVLKLTKVVAWEPGKPFLYDLTIDLEKEGVQLDSVRTYFGLRKVGIDGLRFLINDRPVFQRLVLDQGFYPDGVYTASSDEALRRDIELSMAAGFNGARLHEKVFEPRFLYWADRLGYLVWGEYPNWGLTCASAPCYGQMLCEWREALRRDRNHPSIVGWCPLNETGGGEDVAALQQMLAVTQDIDPTRPFLDASGWTHLCPATDVFDNHDYNQNAEQLAARFKLFELTGREPGNDVPNDPRGRYQGQPFFISEYGGIRLKTERSGAGGWGYGEADLGEFLARYKALTDVLLDNPHMFGFCYTQLTDVEQEQNGVYFYDRSAKFDPALLRAINARPAAYETQPPRQVDLVMNTLAATSQDTGQSWRYTTDEPPADWFAPGFDDRIWGQGPGGFGRAGTPNAVVRTEWLSSDIWLRRSVQVTAADLSFDFAFLVVHHDEDVEVYCNGRKVVELPGYRTSYAAIDVTEALRGLLLAGSNTLAVHCRQREGGQYIDAGLRLARKADKRP